MKYPQRIVFVRHAEMAGNIATYDEAAEFEMPNHRFELTPKGKLQAKLTGDFLREKYWHGFDVAFVSTFRRTQATYEGFGLGRGKVFPRIPIIDSRLNEKYDGVFHGLSQTEIDHHYPSEKRLREKEGWYHHTATGGRSGPEVELAIYSFMDMLNYKYASKSCLVIAHGNWLLLLERIQKNLTSLELERLRKNSEIPNCSVTSFEAVRSGSYLLQEDEGWKLQPVLYRHVPWKDKIKKTKNEHLA